MQNSPGAPPPQSEKGNEVERPPGGGGGGGGNLEGGATKRSSTGSLFHFPIKRAGGDEISRERNDASGGCAI